MTEDGWIEYDGGGQPVDDDVPVQVRLKDGTLSFGGVSASDWDWDINNSRYDITHYRIVKEN